MSVSFDKKLAELDAYLQMLIVENESLDKKLRALTSTSSSSLQNIAAHDSEREGILNIKTNLETLISSIKHAIVLLQIARVSSKNTDDNHPTDPRLKQTYKSTPPLPSTPPPTRPIRSTRQTSSFNCVSQASGSHSSSVELSDSCNSQHSETSNKKQSIKYDSFPQASESQPAAGSNLRQQVDGRPASPTLEALQKASSVAQRRHQATAVASSSSHPATDENRYHNHSSQKNAAVNLSDARASGGLCEAHAEGHNGGGLQSIRRGHDAGELDEEDEDAFYDAPDEQLPKPISSNSNQPSANAATNILDKKEPQFICSEERNQKLDINLSTNPTTHTEAFQLSNSMMVPSPPLASEPAETAANETNNNNDNTIEDGSIDWDAMYEDEEEEELDCMEGEGSVIKHLLSQIRIGMDLTKVVLPTFILERRSLLEMYADFFAHPDLFSAIPDFPTPEARMINLVKWYLSAFHAGRRSSVAKKPYNPILGEIFRCNWNLSESNGASRVQRDPPKRLDKCDTDSNSGAGQQLTFVAEQVSHHPPVSAFYAENKEKNISCRAHIYTKSKYLGLSVGVINVGQGVINLHKHNESYVCTFPDAYGRSILTVPWVELGGSVSITCEQTGYKTNIEFVTKPFYGGKKHRVTGEILRPNNEPIMAIDGEWNGVMYSKSPPNSSRREVFVDTTNLPVIKKHVKSIGAQETFESRNVWKEVTRALKIRDVNSATAAKTYIEQRQRDLLRERQEKGTKWKTRFFEPTEGDGWTYSKPLGSS